MTLRIRPVSTGSKNNFILGYLIMPDKRLYETVILMLVVSVGMLNPCKETHANDNGLHQSVREQVASVAVPETSYKTDAARMHLAAAKERSEPAKINGDTPNSELHPQIKAILIDAMTNGKAKLRLKTIELQVTELRGKSHDIIVPILGYVLIDKPPNASPFMMFISLNEKSNKLVVTKQKNKHPSISKNTMNKARRILTNLSLKSAKGA